MHPCGAHVDQKQKAGSADVTESVCLSARATIFAFVVADDREAVARWRQSRDDCHTELIPVTNKIQGCQSAAPLERRGRDAGRLHSRRSELTVCRCGRRLRAAFAARTERRSSAAALLSGGLSRASRCHDGRGRTTDASSGRRQTLISRNTVAMRNWSSTGLGYSLRRTLASLPR